MIKSISKIKKERGFTIVELLVVIVVIGILAAITIVSYNGITNQANTVKAKSAAQAMASVADIYYSENASYPTGLTGTTGFTATKATKLPSNVVIGTPVSAASATNITLSFEYCSTGYRISWYDYTSSKISSANTTAEYITGGTTCSTWTAASAS